MSERVSPETLRVLFEYFPETGVLVWKPRDRSLFSSDGQFKTWNKRFAGKPAFTATDTHGYNHGSIFKRIYLKHRVVWAILTGKWPDGQIDHIDGDRKNNREVNLRPATNAQNSWNAKSSVNTSGARGVRLHEKTGKWHARIRANGVNYHLGLFSTIEEASAAYSQAASNLHGQFARFDIA